MATAADAIAVWCVTPNGLDIAARLRDRWPGAVIYCTGRLADAAGALPVQSFAGLPETVAARFHAHRRHIFIMAAGIVVRAVGPLLQSKLSDPAVVVVDDAARFAVSLVSGHLGGANPLAEQVAGLLGATAVITTATDAHQRPAIDVLARNNGLKIENPRAIKGCNMALLLGRPLPICDDGRWLAQGMTNDFRLVTADALAGIENDAAGVFIGDQVTALPAGILVLRPPSLVAGIGCNRNTSGAEIGALLAETMRAHGLSPLSLYAIASIDLKRDEVGLLAAAETAGVPLLFFTRDELHQIRHVPNPSHMVAKHIGVTSVCEAAALLSAKPGTLIVTKHKSTNATVAIARRDSSWSASAREA